jgi:hypothetical protein
MRKEKRKEEKLKEKLKQKLEEKRKKAKESKHEQQLQRARAAEGDSDASSSDFEPLASAMSKSKARESQKLAGSSDELESVSVIDVKPKSKKGTVAATVMKSLTSAMSKSKARELQQLEEGTVAATMSQSQQVQRASAAEGDSDASSSAIPSSLLPENWAAVHQATESEEGTVAANISKSQAEGDSDASSSAIPSSLLLEHQQLAERDSGTDYQSSSLLHEYRAAVHQANE